MESMARSRENIEMRELHLVCVGKLKDPALEAVEADYLKRIVNPRLVIHEVRANAEDKDAESEALAKKLREWEKDGPLHRIALTEWGTRQDSRAFAQWSARLLERPSKIVFLIAGAHGFTPGFLEGCQERVSLSELTFPHKLARILLVEQLYRAQTLRTGHPYHN